MTAYYNEIDRNAAEWLRILIAGGYIAPGDVDERSIADVRPDELAGYDQCHFFAGIGGWSYALRLAGWPDARPVWTGSCPCQPFSAAGSLERFSDERHLWPTWVRLIAERRPTVIFGEQVASATEWLRLVRGDLEALDYAVGCSPIEAASAGADHLRDRFWFVADAMCAERRPQSEGRNEPERNDAGRQEAAGGFAVRGSVDVADTDQPCAGDGHLQRGRQLGGAECDPRARALGDGASERGNGSEDTSRPDRRASPENSGGFVWINGADGKARRVKSGLRLLAHGIPGRVGLLRGFGNAIDPRPAAEFIGAASEAMKSLSAGERGKA